MFDKELQLQNTKYTQKNIHLFIYHIIKKIL